MNQVIKKIQATDYIFNVDTEQNSQIFLTVVVYVAANQETQFRKLRENSSILKEIAVNAAKAINENFEFMLNPDDSGSEWRGQFKLIN